MSCPKDDTEFSPRKKIDTKNNGIVLCGESLWLMTVEKETMCTKENKANLAAACCNLSQSIVSTNTPVNSPQDGAPDGSMSQYNVPTDAPQ